jgi:hypothetical protein
MVRAGGAEMRPIKSIGVTLRDIPDGAKIAVEVAPEVQRPYSFYDVHPPTTSTLTTRSHMRSCEALRKWNS